ncbi:hypothetical protein F5884DRAFT_769280 [Xylogone sp. PMI_703]|nr:hypothetical protein F5884DRAFT_769280 [Xylogone sp. PMI_703]
MANQLRASYPYKKGDILTLTLIKSYVSLNQNTTEASPTTITAEIIDMFEPFTISPVMRVRLDGSTQILKLYDRRSCLALRKYHHMDNWSPEIEREYCEYVHGGQASKFISYLDGDESGDEDDENKNDDQAESDDKDKAESESRDEYGSKEDGCEDDEEGDESDDEDSWTNGQKETRLYKRCRDSYNSEVMAYEALSDLQGTSIPLIYATVSFRTRSADDPELQKYFDIPGVLLEDCAGFTLEKLSENVPNSYWQDICDHAVSIVNSVSDHNVLNRDVKPENFLVMQSKKDSRMVYRPVMIDFGCCRVRATNESDEDWRESKRGEDEEGAIGLVMQERLKKRGGYYTYRPSYRYDTDEEGMAAE